MTESEREMILKTNIGRRLNEALVCGLLFLIISCTQETEILNIKGYRYHLSIPSGFDRVSSPDLLPNPPKRGTFVFRDSTKRKRIYIFSEDASKDLSEVVRKRISIIKEMNTDAEILSKKWIKEDRVMEIEYVMPNFDYAFKSYSRERFELINENHYIRLLYFTLGQPIQSRNPKEEGGKVLRSFRRIM